jgi:hypothetical protein
MKPRLTVLLGAGSTFSLAPDIPGCRGMPSTDELTARLSKMQFPKVVLCGTPFLLDEKSGKPFSWNTAVPVLPLIHRALSNAFQSVNFELILYAIEQMLPLADMRAGFASTDSHLPAIAAFVEI